MRRLFETVFFSFTAAAVLVQLPSPSGELVKPPANARHFVVQSIGGKHGDAWSWVAPDGTRMARESWNVRGHTSNTESSGTTGADGMPATITIRGVNPRGDAAETFTISNGTAAWKSPTASGRARYAAPAFYLTEGGPFNALDWMFETLLARPDKTMDLLPGGKAQATRLTDLEVGTGETRQTVTLWAVTGIATAPQEIWSDSKNKFFAMSLGIAWLPEAYAGEQRRLEEAQTKALSARAAHFANTLVTVPTNAVAFTGVRLFDADAMRFVSDQTVIVDKGLITAVGARNAVTLPAGAKVIDGSGKTLVPGLWDCHMHVGGDNTGLQELSMGVTSVRDPGNDDRETIERRTRSAAGELLFPHVYPSSLIDGKSTYTAQVANVATSEEEAIALVDKAKANNFTGVKFYGSFDAAWLPASIREAHKLGLHVHGHVPHGIRPIEAINDGYDELTHINWVIMQAMPDSVIPVSNGPMRFEGPGRFGKDVDLDGSAIKTIIDAMVKKHIYSDPTMVAFEALYEPDNGDLSPSYAPFVGTMPANSERLFRRGGLKLPKDVTRADYRASWARMIALLGRMHQAGIPIVAGTDGQGIELIHELEIYVQAGFTPAEALATATIVPARLLGVEAKTGSIIVGKTADLALVEGDPSVKIGDLRHTRVVMMDGKLLDADALFHAAGFTGRTK